MRSSGIRNVAMTFFLVFFGISSSNRLADDERADGEFQKRSSQYCDAYVSYAKKLTPYLFLSHRRSIGAVMASVLCAPKLKESITAPTATSIAT